MEKLAEGVDSAAVACTGSSPLRISLLPLSDLHQRNPWCRLKETHSGNSQLIHSPSTSLQSRGLLFSQDLSPPMEWEEEGRDFFF